MAGKRLLDSGRSFDVTHDPKYIWQDDAACAFMDPKIFYPLMRGSLQAATTSEAEVLELNEKNFEQARKACASCPVFSQCEAETTSDDRRFVFRAGKAPTGYSGRPVGRPVKKPKRTPYVPKPLSGPCNNGHADQWFRDRRGNRRCLQCQRDAGKRYLDKVSPDRKSRSNGTHCIRGHELTSENIVGNGSRRCRACKNQTRRNAYAASTIKT